jgi:hypothetical protein
MDASKCEPGGAEATADLSYAMDVYFKGPEEADTGVFGAPLLPEGAAPAENAAPADAAPAEATAEAPPAP